MIAERSISVVVPIFNGDKYIDALISRIRACLPTLASSYEVILIDDGSTDNSWEKIARYAGAGDVIGIRMAKNCGQHAATMAGILQARKRYIATMDQDLQHNPADLAVLMEKLDSGCQLVYGAPITKPNNAVRNILTAMAKRALSFAANQKSLVQISAFRMFDSGLKSYLEEYRGPQIILDVVLLWGASNVSTVEVDIAPSEKSNYNYLSLINVTIRVLISFSTAPLRLASWIGFSMTILGFAVLMYVLWVYFTQGSIPGFPFLASLVTLFGGAQLFVFGIFGEYLAKIYEATLGKPIFTIAEIVKEN